MFNTKKWQSHTNSNATHFKALSFNKIKENKFTPICLIILLGIIICIPFFTLNLIKTSEFLIHIIRSVSVKELISDGVFPPLISYKHMNGLGYGINIFYGVFTTYTPVLISYLTNSISLAIKIFTLFSVIFSGLTMYFFVCNVTKSKTAGVISALIYMSAPYRLTDIYNRAALGEYIAFIFIPIVFNGLYYLINDNKKGNYILILGASFLILTHTITTIYTVMFAIIFLLFNIKKIINATFWKNILIDIVIILMLTAFYTIPIMEHKLETEYTIFQADEMNATSNDVYENTNSLLQWLNISLLPKPNNELDFSLGIPVLFLILTTIVTYKKVNTKYKRTYNICLILSIICGIMCTKIFPWNLMPHFLTIIQFATRINGFLIFFISIICGINTYVLAEELIKNRDKYIGAIITLIFICSILNISNKFSKPTGEDERYEKLLLNATKIGVYNINREYMPEKAYVKRDWIDKRENKTFIISGNATIKDEFKDKLYSKIEIETDETVELELPYLYYLGYTTLLNGEKIDNYESNNGMLAVKFDKSGTLEVKYDGTNLEKLGYIISLIGIIVFILVNIKHKAIYKNQERTN